MSSVPAEHRGVASGMRSTFQDSGMSLTIGTFFTLMILGLASRLPATLTAGLASQGVPAAAITRVAHVPPVSALFAAVAAFATAAAMALTGALASLLRDAQFYYGEQPEDRGREIS